MIIRNIDGEIILSKSIDSLEKANLRNANLRNVDLSGSNLSNSNLSGADLREADLREADLRGADLRGTNLDYSCFPLWCGGTNFKCSDGLVYQLLDHISSLHFNRKDEFIKILKDNNLYGKSHRVKKILR